MQKYFSPRKLDTSIHFLSSLDGPPVVAHYDLSDTNSDPEVVNVDNLLAAAVVQEHSNSVGGQDTGATWRTSGLLEELNAEAGWSPHPLLSQWYNVRVSWKLISLWWTLLRRADQLETSGIR